MFRKSYVLQRRINKSVTAKMGSYFFSFCIRVIEGESLVYRCCWSVVNNPSRSVMISSSVPWRTHRSCRGLNPVTRVEPTGTILWRIRSCQNGTALQIHEEGMIKAQLNQAPVFPTFQYCTLRTRPEFNCSRKSNVARYAGAYLVRINICSHY